MVSTEVPPDPTDLPIAAVASPNGNAGNGGAPARVVDGQAQPAVGAEVVKNRHLNQMGGTDGKGATALMCADSWWHSAVRSTPLLPKVGAW